MDPLTLLVLDLHWLPLPFLEYWGSPCAGMMLQGGKLHFYQVPRPYALSSWVRDAVDTWVPSPCLPGRGVPLRALSAPFKL